MMINEKIVATRRARLRAWIAKYPGDSKGRGKQAAFIADTGLDQTEISSLLKNKSFGEKKAQTIEQAAKMPVGHLSMPTDNDYEVLPVAHAAGDVLAIQMALESLVTALRMSAPVAARDFAEQLRRRAARDHFSVDRGMLGTLLGIVERDQNTAAKVGVLRLPRGSVAKSK
jgi:hypothetical protein